MYLDQNIGYAAHGVGELDPDRYARNRYSLSDYNECRRCGEAAYDGEYCYECLEELCADDEDE